MGGVKGAEGLKFMFSKVNAMDKIDFLKRGAPAGGLSPKPSSSIAPSSSAPTPELDAAQRKKYTGRSSLLGG